MFQFITYEMQRRNLQLKFIVVLYIQPTNQPFIGPSGCAFFVGTFDAASKVHIKWEQSQSSEFQNSNFKQTQFGATLSILGMHTGMIGEPMPPDMVRGG